MKKSDLTHEITLNVGGASIITVRVDEETAKSVGKAIDVPVPGIKWPVSIRGIGQRTALEQNALAQAIAPKLAVGEGEIVMVVWGRTIKEREPLSLDDLKAYATALEYNIRRVLEDIDGESIEWECSVGMPGTLITRNFEEKPNDDGNAAQG